MKHKLFISGVGMVTPLGDNLAMTSAAVKAGLNVYADSNNIDSRGFPIKMALVPKEALTVLTEATPLYGKYTHWYKQALQMSPEAVKQAMTGYQPSHPIPLILNLPERPILENRPLPETFLENLSLLSGVPFAREHFKVIHSGRAGVMEALVLAEQYLYEGGFDEVLIGGVDSFQIPSRLDILMAEQRLALEQSMDAFTPGEAACFLRISRHEQQSLYGGAHFSSPELASEQGHLYSDEPYTGEGLSNAVAGALAKNSMPPATTAYVSANGERYWAKELGTALIRHSDYLDENIDVKHPAEFYGDLGAATGAVLMALAAELGETGETQIICASSDFALRGVVLFGEASAEIDQSHSVKNRESV